MYEHFINLSVSEQMLNGLLLLAFSLGFFLFTWLCYSIWYWMDDSPHMGKNPFAQKFFKAIRIGRGLGLGYGTSFWEGALLMMLLLFLPLLLQVLLSYPLFPVTITTVIIFMLLSRFVLRLHKKLRLHTKTINAHS